jgi:uncharacterized RDD family membrane protein YckC
LFSVGFFASDEAGVIAVILGLMDVLWPLWDEENRALHDFFVDTRVVRD